MPGPARSAGPAASAPVVRRGREIRSTLILRIFAVERFLRALAFGALAYVVWRFSSSRQSIEAAFDRERPVLRSLLDSKAILESIKFDEPSLEDVFLKLPQRGLEQGDE